MQLDISIDFPLPGFWSDRAAAEAVYAFDGQQYALRYLEDNVLYRVLDHNRVEHTLFVPIAAGVGDKSLAPILYPEDAFAAQVRGGQSGRMALYTHAEARDCRVALFFLPDGTGYFCDYDTVNNYSLHEAREQVNFIWHTRKGSDEAAPVDILRCEWADLLPICRQVFVEQVWPRMQNPYVAWADLPDEPLTFLCGSRAELEHITRCICHADSTLFRSADTSQSLTVYYEAATQATSGGYAEDAVIPKQMLSAATVRMLRLAFQASTFRGGAWEYSRYHDDARSHSYTFMETILSVTAAPPSAHERTEAKLALYEWLEGKVTGEERNHLLGLA